MPNYAFQNVAIAKEIESPENPGGLEKRVALIPSDVKKLCDLGLNLSVEIGAGEEVGFSDNEYCAAGARLESSEEIYREKDLIIKFKGPALDSVRQMQKKSTLFCMAHFHSFPDRAKLLQEQSINVIAMEEVLESPKEDSDNIILSRTAMACALQPFIENASIEKLNIRVIGWTSDLSGCVRRAGNRSPASLQVLPLDLKQRHIDVSGKDALYFYDSEVFDDRHHLLKELSQHGTHIFDRADFVEKNARQAIAKYRESHPPHIFGIRRIQCLHETGMAGARYGLTLLRKNKPHLDITRAKVLVLGYGNVGSGAMHEIYDQGVERIHILGRRHTRAEEIIPYLQHADLIVNGAEQPLDMRGKNFLITKEHVQTHIPENSVIIDLVGGSPSNRSPVESVLSCTFLTDPHFVENGVSISSLWGWPMMGMMRETAIRYSGQICDVLIGKENLITGIKNVTPGVERAIVCGPF